MCAQGLTITKNSLTSSGCYLSYTHQGTYLICQVKGHSAQPEHEDDVTSAIALKIPVCSLPLIPRP